MKPARRFNGAGRRWTWLLAGLLGAGAVAAAVAVAQQAPRGWNRGTDLRLSAPLREGLPERRGGFTFCRLLFSSVRREAGGLGWSTDYPGADNNFSIRLGQITTTNVSGWLDGQPGYAVVRATDPGLFECPFLFASDIGTAGFAAIEIERLREYLLKGGFLWVDDFWGERAWAHWTAEIQRILPGSTIEELSLEHPLFATFYRVPRVPQIPSMQFWRRSGGATSERGAESARPTLSAIFDDHGNIMVLMSHNTDIADGWERETDDEDFFYRFTAEGYGVGINVAVWAMTR
jgi:hypothetical protein